MTIPIFSKNEAIALISNNNTGNTSCYAFSDRDVRKITEKIVLLLG